MACLGQDGDAVLSSIAAVHLADSQFMNGQGEQSERVFNLLSSQYLANRDAPVGNDRRMLASRCIETLALMDRDEIPSLLKERLIDPAVSIDEKEFLLTRVKAVAEGQWPPHHRYARTGAALLLILESAFGQLPEPPQLKSLVQECVKALTP
jgi:hypothetical protein